MGGAASKESSNQELSNGLLLRSLSVPSSRNETECTSKLSWRSRLFSMSASKRKEKGHLASSRFSSKLKLVKEEDCNLHCEEPVDYQSALSLIEESMGKLDITLNSKRTVNHLDQSFSFQPRLLECLENGMPIAWCKSPSRGSTCIEGSNMPNLNSESQLCKSISFRLTATLDRNTGLGLLLSPSVASESIASPAREMNLQKQLPLKGSSLRWLDERGVSLPMKNQTSWLSTVTQCAVGGFDPFVPEFGSSESRSTSSSSSDSPTQPCMVLSSSLSSCKAPKECDRQDFLGKFELRCPVGCENKAVLYFTSLHAIRKTFDDCCTVRSILGGFRIRVDERDVWMHSQFRKELTDGMGAALPVPRLFVLGYHIGGADEVKQLHEEGILGVLLDGLPKGCSQACGVCGDARFFPCMMCSGSCKMIGPSNESIRCVKCNENGLIMCPACGCW